MTWTAAAATPRPAIHRPRLPPARSSAQQDPGRGEQGGGGARRPGQELEPRPGGGVAGDQPADQELDVVVHDRNGRPVR
jgi:hypothetical protein